jgi:hypothetical protein
MGTPDQKQPLHPEVSKPKPFALSELTKGKPYICDFAQVFVVRSDSEITPRCRQATAPSTLLVRGTRRTPHKL